MLKIPSLPCIFAICLWLLGAVQPLPAQIYRSYIIPDICAPGMGTYIEIIGDASKYGHFGADGIYTNNPGDSVRVELDRPEEDAGKVFIGPLSVAWGGRMIATHVFVLPTVQPNDSYWNNLHDEFRIPLRVIVRGRIDSIAMRDTIYIVRPFTKIEEFSTAITPDSTAIGVLVNGTERRSIRSRRGAVIAENVQLIAGKKYGIATDDTDPFTEGNQGYLPFVFLVRGTFEGNGATIDASAQGKNAGPGGGGGGGQVCDNAIFSSVGNMAAQSGGSGFTGGAGGGVNSSGITLSTWFNGGSGSMERFASPLLPGGRVHLNTDGGFSLNGIPGGVSKNNDSEHPESTGGGTGHPFGRSGRGGISGMMESAGGGFGRGQRLNGDGGGFGRDGLTNDPTAQNIGGGQHGNIAVVPIAGGSGGASGNPQGPGLCGGSGGGGGGAIRLAAAAVKNISLVARGAIGERGNQLPLLGAAPHGGAGSGGHVAIHSKLPVEGIKANVQSGEDENAGAGRMRFDTPNRIDDVSPRPTGNTYRFHTSINLDTAQRIRSPYSAPIQINGYTGDQTVIRFFYRTTSGTWQYGDTVPSRQIPTGFNIPVAFRTIITPPRAQDNEQDSLLFVVAAEEFNLFINRDIPPYTINPKWIFSQSAANIYRVQPLPLITVNPANEVVLPEIVRCEGEEQSTTFTVIVRNLRGGVLEVRDIRFEGDLGAFLDASPRSFTVQQNASQQVRITFRASLQLRTDIETFLGRMLIVHNDTLPDVGGQMRPNPWPLNITAKVQTVRFDIRPTDNNLQPLPGGVLDFGRVAVGGTATENIRMVNANPQNRTPMRFSITAERQPIGIAPFSFDERTTVSNLGSIVIPVQFSPTMIGTAPQQAVLVRVQNAQGSCPFDSTYRIILIGTGIEPRLDTTRTTRSINFGILSGCALETTTSSFTVTLANSGNDTLLVRNIRMNSTTSNFSPTLNNLSIPPGQSASFSLRFASFPTTLATQTLRDTVLVETNDARFSTQNPFRIPVVLELRTTLVSLRLIPPDTFINFGNVRYFLRAERSIILTNNGNSTVTVHLSNILRQPYRLISPQQTRFVLPPQAAQTITVEMLPSDNLPEGVSFLDTLQIQYTAEGSLCPIAAPQQLFFSGMAQGPAAILARLWLDTLHSVDMRRDTVIRLWGSVQTAVQGRTDSLRAGFVIRRSMFFPTSVQSSFGQARIEANRIQGRDRMIILRIPNVALQETPSIIAELKGTPVLTDTAWSALEWIPDETWWSRRDSVYYNERLTNGFIATLVPILHKQPRLTSGPVVGQMPQRIILRAVQPNPTDEYLNISIAVNEHGEYQIHIVNTQGERVFEESWKEEEEHIPSPLQERTIIIKVRHLSSGAYLLRLISPSGSVETMLLGIER